MASPWVAGPLHPGVALSTGENPPHTSNPCQPPSQDQGAHCVSHWCDHCSSQFPALPGGPHRAQKPLPVPSRPEWPANKARPHWATTSRQESCPLGRRGPGSGHCLPRTLRVTQTPRCVRRWVHWCIAFAPSHEDTSGTPSDLSPSPGDLVNQWLGSRGSCWKKLSLIWELTVLIYVFSCRSCVVAVASASNAASQPLDEPPPSWSDPLLTAQGHPRRQAFRKTGWPAANELDLGSYSKCVHSGTSRKLVTTEILLNTACSSICNY